MVFNIIRPIYLGALSHWKPVESRQVTRFGFFYIYGMFSAKLPCLARLTSFFQDIGAFFIQLFPIPWLPLSSVCAPYLSLQLPPLQRLTLHGATKLAQVLQLLPAARSTLCERAPDLGWEPWATDFFWEALLPLRWKRYIIFSTAVKWFPTFYISTGKLRFLLLVADDPFWIQFDSLHFRSYRAKPIGILRAPRRLPCFMGTDGWPLIFFYIIVIALFLPWTHQSYLLTHFNKQYLSILLPN